MIAWELRKKNEPLVRVERDFEELADGWSRVKVAGCGLCHTDLGFIYTSVQTKHELPLVLGHEISGIVELGRMKGRQVIIPAVIPCNHCAPCLAGHPRICLNQVMPGNDIHGGFASHIDVPDHELVPIPKVLGEDDLARISVVADAVTTPLQAIHNVGLKAGDVAIVIGCGGVGSFAALLAKSMGAFVFAMDVDDRKLKKLATMGIAHTQNVKGMNSRDLKKLVRTICSAESYPNFGHKLFETSGTTAGQEAAFGMLNFGAKLAVVGFTMDKLEVRLSNLMAFDAQLVGNWGSSPGIYPEAIQIALEGHLHLEDFTELTPLSRINETIEAIHHHGSDRRMVLVP